MIMWRYDVKVDGTAWQWQLVLAKMLMKSTSEVQSARISFFIVQQLATRDLATVPFILSVQLRDVSSVALTSAICDDENVRLEVAVTSWNTELLHKPNSLLSFFLSHSSFRLCLFLSLFRNFRPHFFAYPSFHLSFLPFFSLSFFMPFFSLFFLCSLVFRIPDDGQVQKPRNSDSYFLNFIFLLVRVLIFFFHISLSSHASFLSFSSFFLCFVYFSFIYRILLFFPCLPSCFSFLLCFISDLSLYFHSILFFLPNCLQFLFALRDLRM
jgi:hypothetical protein